MSGFEGSGKAGTKAAKGAATQGLAAELRTTTAKVQQSEARKEQSRRRRAERKLQQDAQQWATCKIAELPEKMREAAREGRSSYTVFQWIRESDREAWAAWRIVCEYASEQGLKTWTDKMEPFGSDPLFDHTVFSLGVSW